MVKEKHARDSLCDTIKNEEKDGNGEVENIILTFSQAGHENGRIEGVGFKLP